MKMKWLAGVAMLMLTTPGAALLAQTPSVEEQYAADQKRFADMMAQAVHPVSVTDGKLSGSGGDWLAALVRDADILKIGETHGTGTIAETAGAIVAALPDDRPLVYAQEIGPSAALKMEPMLRGPEAALNAYMTDPRAAISYPFLSLREEVAFARQVLARAKPGTQALWGLDQEFVTAAPMLLDRLEGYARMPAQRAAVALARNTLSPLMALSETDPASFDALDAAFANGPEAARRLLADMRLSNEIYRLQDSEVGRSNREREDYMKRNLMTHWNATGNAKPRVVMKFGAYHMVAGLSPTSTPALGSFVNALALMEDRKVVSVLIICGPQGQQTDFQGNIISCDADFEETVRSEEHTSELQSH